MPQFIWVDVDSLNNLNEDKFIVLKGRRVLLFPDLKGLDRWTIKAKEFSHLASISVSDLLERKTSDAEREQGLDIADYLVNYRVNEFIASNNTFSPDSHTKIDCIQCNSVEENVKWINDFLYLITYYKSITTPPTPIKLNECLTITDVSKFIDINIRTAWSYEGNSITLLCLNRLAELKQYIENNNDLQ